MELALILPPWPNERWRLALQLGVTHAVTTLPGHVAGGHQAYSPPGVPQPIVPSDVPPKEHRPWDFMPLLLMLQRFREAGITVSVIEASPPMHRARLGLPGRDEEIEWVITLLRNMGKLEIPVWCWNWMAVINWARTSVTTPTRGGALTTSYDHELMEQAGPTEVGTVTEQQLWESLRYFLEAVVPVAEEAGVKLALHPDDPPVPALRGIARILITPESLQKALDLYPSPMHGLTFCQGTLSTMGADIPRWIGTSASKRRSISSISGTSAARRLASLKHSRMMGRPICSKRCGPTTRSASRASCVLTMFRPWKANRIRSRVT
ncbi:Mannonate dehydratase [bacterium HR27]|nr:Mannonate dehydratase [bacterium HR27]